MNEAFPVPPEAIDPTQTEQARMTGEVGAISFAPAAAAINGLRRGILDMRIRRTVDAIDNHDEEADYARALRIQTGAAMGEERDAAGNIVTPHTKSKPKPHTHHVNGASALSSSAKSVGNVRELRARAGAAHRADGTFRPINHTGTSIEDPTPGSKSAIRDLEGNPITRQTDPPTKWSKRLERQWSRRLQNHTELDSQLSNQEGKLGSHRRAGIRTKVQNASGRISDLVDRSLSPMERTDRKRARIVNSVHVPSRNVKRGAKNIEKLRGGTLEGLDKVATERSNLAAKKARKLAELQAKRSRL